MRHMLFACLAAILTSAAPVSAATLVTVTVGDDDCFGLDIACPEFIPAPSEADQPFDNASPGDPANQDVFGAIGRSTFEVTLDLTDQRISNVSLTARIWGAELASFPPGTHPGPFGDAFAGSRFLVNDIDIGTYAAESTPDGQSVNRVEIVVFDVMADTLVTGLNTITVIPEEDFIDLIGLPETYALDFVELSYHTTPIPLPGGLALALGALGLLVIGAGRRPR